MRSTLALVLICLAGWRGYLDYSASTALGEELALMPTDALWETISPGTYGSYLPILQKLETPYIWDPVMQNVLSWPAALLLGGLGIFFFLIRRKSEPKIEVY